MDFNVNIMIIGQNITLREAVKKELNYRAYPKINSLTSFETAINNLEAKKLYWFLIFINKLNIQSIVSNMSLLADNKNKYSDIRFSIFISEEYESKIPSFYSKGILSHHKYELSTGEIKTELNQIFKLIKESYFSEVDFSCHYFRKHLIAQKSYLELENLDEKLHSLQKKNSNYYMNFIESKFLNNQVKAGKNGCVEFKYQFPEENERILKLESRFLANKKDSPDKNSPAEKFSINTLYIVDHFIESSNRLVRSGKAVGINNIKIFDNHESCWQKLSENDIPCLMILRWKSKKIDGMQLLQKIKQNKLNFFPILIISNENILPERCFSKDYMIYNHILESANSKEIYLTLLWTIYQFRKPSQGIYLERKIYRYIEAGDIFNVNQLAKIFFSLSSPSLSRKLLIESKILYFENKFEEAIDQLNLSIDNAIGSYTEQLILLSKCFLKTGKINESIYLLKKIIALNPSHIQIKTRKTPLINQDWIGVNRENKEEISYNISQNKIPSQDLTEITEITNNLAIGYVKSGKIDIGISIYKDLLIILKAKNLKLFLIVSYNLALAYIRKKRITEAKKFLKSILIKWDSKKFPKIDKLYKSISLKSKITIKEYDYQCSKDIFSDDHINKLDMKVSDLKSEPINPTGIGLQGIYRERKIQKGIHIAS